MKKFTSFGTEYITVKELREELQKFPDEALILVNTEYTLCKDDDEPIATLTKGTVPIVNNEDDDRYDHVEVSVVELGGTYPGVSTIKEDLCEDSK
jgi:hypothetical protein